MAIEQVPRVRCDRPGCNAVVTENGGRFAVGAIGPYPAHIDPSWQGCNEMGIAHDVATAASVDLCRACAESLRTWWASKDARAATKAVGK